VDPALLGLGSNTGVASMNRQKWPYREDKKVPLLLHTSAIRFHYGERVFSGYESGLWFKQLTSALHTQGGWLCDFLHELVGKLWVPQTAAFMATQLRRAVRESAEPEV
jgi:hypothetical protein